MAPVLSFTAEEIWNFIPGKNEESAFLSAFPVFDAGFYDAPLEERWERLRVIRDAVNKALELKRKERFIGNSLEAKVILALPDEDYALLHGQKDFLTSLFIVSEVVIDKGPAPVGDISKSTDLPGVSVSIQKASGDKCQRCWNWSIEVGTFEDAPELCQRCYDVLC
jgi:isoleucyl-tRNA synthetase